MSEIAHLTKETFADATSTADKTVVVDFWAPWCGPCKMLAPVLDEVAAELGDAVGIYKVNIDETPELAQEHGVQSIPTLLVYKGGSLSETIVGVKSKDELVSIVQG
tara:strand:- start:190 stop:507 length:318 start_codon:yes stop_codon:yes gene_type:complete